MFCLLVDTAVIRYPLEIYKRRKMCFCFALNRRACSQVTPELLWNYRAHNNKLPPKMRRRNLCMSCRLVCGERTAIYVNGRWKFNGSEKKYVERISTLGEIPHRDDPHKIWMALLRLSTLANGNIYTIYWIHVWCIMNLDFLPQQKKPYTPWRVCIWILE